MLYVMVFWHATDPLYILRLCCALTTQSEKLEAQSHPLLTGSPLGSVILLHFHGLNLFKFNPQSSSFLSFFFSFFFGVKQGKEMWSRWKIYAEGSSRRVYQNKSWYKLRSRRPQTPRKIIVVFRLAMMTPSAKTVANENYCWSCTITPSLTF